MIVTPEILALVGALMQATESHGLTSSEAEAARMKLLDVIAMPPRIDSAGGSQVFVPQAHGKLS